MADDFRLAVEFEEEGHVLHFGRSLGAREFEQDLREQFGDGVVVTRDGRQLFLYAGTREQADAAEAVVRHALAEHEMTAKFSPVMRWHPVEERWEDASAPLPQTSADIEAEHERLEERETEEARELGYAEWEVRIDLPTHKDAVDFAKRLEDEGIAPVIRRWKYILIGTATDDDANTLAERLRAEVPQGATVQAEPSATIEYELTSQNPFAMFGGFGPKP